MIFLLTIVTWSSILSSFFFFKVYFPLPTLLVTKKVYFYSLNSRLLDRLLDNDALDQYKEFIVKVKKNKPKKRIHVSGESKNKELIKNSFEKENVKRKIRFPKNKK